MGFLGQDGRWCTSLPPTSFTRTYPTAREPGKCSQALNREEEEMVFTDLEKECDFQSR